VSELGAIRRLPLRGGAAAETSPRAVLLDAVREIDEEGFDPTGVFVLAIQEVAEEDGTTTLIDHWWMAGKSMAQMSRTVGWLEYFKAKLLAEMTGRR
jgi:hypothetical protein